MRISLQTLDQPVCLFPFTMEAVLFHHILKRHGIQTACFCDNKEALWSQQYDGVGFCSPAQAVTQFPGGTAVICGYRHYEREAELRAAGFATVLPIEQLLTREDVEAAAGDMDVEAAGRLAPRQRYRLERAIHEIRSVLLPEKAFGIDRFILDNIDIVVTEKCTLKCRHCSNMTQFYKNPQHFGKDAIIQDMDRLMGKVDFIRIVRVIGGEALLHPSLVDLVNHLGVYRQKYGLFRFITNGTLVPSEPVLDALKDAGAFIKISDYGPHSAKADALIDHLHTRNLPYQREAIQWTYMQQLLSTHQKDYAAIFQKCESKTLCHVMLDHKLYSCPFLAFAEKIRAIPYNSENHVDLHSADKETIREYFKAPFPFPGCAYCSGNHKGLPPVPTAEQIKEPIPYKRFDGYPD